MKNMLSQCAENIVSLLKSQDLREYGIDNLDNLAKLFFLNDLESGVEWAKSTRNILLIVPNIIYLDKLNRFLSKTYRCFEDQVIMSSKFDRNQEGYVQFVKKVLSYINDMEDDEKLDCFSNLTRSCLLELIDIPLYFKMVNILKRLTVDELIYLKNNIKKSINKLDVYVESCISTGLVKMILSTPDGNNKYEFTELAQLFVNYALLLDAEEFESADKMLTMSDINVKEPKTMGAFVQRTNGNISLSRDVFQ